MKTKMKMKIIITKKNLILLITILVILTILYNCYSIRFKGQTACHYIETVDDVPLIDFHRNSVIRHIYFHQTSCNGDLDAYEMCAVESAARSHYGWQINVIFSSPVHGIVRLRKHFHRFRNVKLWRMHINKYLRDTPLQHLVAERLLQTSKYSFTQTREVLRYATLYKWDGVYLDLNMLIVKSLHEMPMNFATRNIYPSVSDEILGFANDRVGRSMAEAAIRDVVQTFDKTVSLHNGTGTMTRVLTDRCKLFENTLGAVHSCNGFYVFAPDYFYKITWRMGAKFTVPSYIGKNFSYGYRLGDNANFTKISLATKAAIYSILAKSFCPYTYEKFQEEF